MMIFNFCYRFTASYIECPLNTTTGNPISVSIVENGQCSMPLHSLPVLSSTKKILRNFTICVAPLRFQTPITYQLIEWIELNRILGVELFVFYNYTVTDTDSHVLEFYSKRGLAEVHPWNLLLDENSIHYFGQMAAINDCILKHQNDTKYIAILDLDEFIIPRRRSDITWKDMILPLPEAGSYVFQHAFFPLNVKSTTKRVHKESKRGSIPTNERQIFNVLERRAILLPYNIRSKVIINPRRTYICTIHYVSNYTGIDVRQIKREIKVEEDIALLHHYRDGPLKDTGNKMVQDKTLLKYWDILMPRIRNTWNLISASSERTK